MPTPLRVLALALLAAAVLSPSSRADGGPSPGISLGGKVIADSHGVTYAAQPAGNRSYLVVRNRAGRAVRTRTFDAVYGLPRVTFGNNTVGGLSRDGRTLVVAQPELGGGLAAESRLLVLD